MEANRTVKMMARTEKQSHINDPPSQAEDAASRGEQRKIYKIIRLLCVRYIVGTDAPMMDQQRRLLITEAEQDAQQKINFLDFEKAFHSMYLESLWCIVQAYGMLQQIIDIIESFYNNFTCRVGNSETSFPVKSGVRRGCTMSEMLST